MTINKTKIFEVLKANIVKENILVKGWVRTKRNSKNFSFIELNDGSCLKNLQIIADNSLLNYEDIKKINTGSAINVNGFLRVSKGSRQKWELQARKIEIISLADDNFPLQKKRHSDEFLRTIAHLRPRTNKYGAMFRIRSNLSWAIHKFFRDKHFSYIHTPIITGSDCEGAGDMFKVTTIDPIASKDENNTGLFSNDFFGAEANLTVSGQLSAEMFAMSLGDVYSFGPTFRAENSNTSRHVAEFWMLEPEMAFCDLQQNIKIAEELVKFLINFAMNECREDLDLFFNFVDKDLEKTLNNIVSSTFVSIEYKEAVDILLKSKEKFKFKVKLGLDLQSEHERYITEKYFRKPVIIFNYPKAIKPFYMRLNDDNETVAAMDIIVPRIGELIGGSQREERFDVLIKRMLELSISEKKYWWYIDSRRYGSVTHSGFGLGFERLLMLITGATNIRDVIPFPRTPGNIEF